MCSKEYSINVWNIKRADSSSENVLNLLQLSSTKWNSNMKGENRKYSEINLEWQDNQFFEQGSTDSQNFLLL